MWINYAFLFCPVEGTVHLSKEVFTKKLEIFFLLLPWQSVSDYLSAPWTVCLTVKNCLVSYDMNLSEYDKIINIQLHKRARHLTFVDPCVHAWLCCELCACGVCVTWCDVHACGLTWCVCARECVCVRLCMCISCHTNHSPPVSTLTIHGPEIITVFNIFKIKIDQQRIFFWLN